MKKKRTCKTSIEVINTHKPSKVIASRSAKKTYGKMVNIHKSQWKLPASWEF